jgi:DTW domain-containing protein YfiP
METRTHIVLLMHPKEWRREKCATGRLACLNLANSEIIPGLSFEQDPKVRAIVADPCNYPVLLYPGENAVVLDSGLPSRDASAEAFPGLGARRLVVFLLDATWSCSRTMAKANPSLLALPRVMFAPKERSRFRIKRQPADWCLSTLEAIHELLRALEASGLEDYPDKTRLLAAFDAMQDFQIECSREAGRPRFLSRETWTRHADPDSPREPDAR